MMPAPHSLPLRDIHLPPPVSWWPPAPGWYLVAALGVVLILGLAYWAYRRRQRRVQRAAQTELQRLRRTYIKTGDGQRLARELSVLLRRVCLSRLPREQVAGMTGEAWLALLDRQLPEKQAGGFSQGPGRALVEAPYNPRARVEGEQLLTLCAVWIQQLPAHSREAA
jgi:hypothetical protein